MTVLLVLILHKKCLLNSIIKEFIFIYVLTCSESKEEEISSVKFYICFSLSNRTAWTEAKRIHSFVCDVTMQPPRRMLLKFPCNASVALHVFHGDELEMENVIVLQT